MAARVGASPFGGGGGARTTLEAGWPRGHPRKDPWVAARSGVASSHPRATSGGGSQATKPPQGWLPPPLSFFFFFFNKMRLFKSFLKLSEGI
jgi:hypothetical protein